MDDLKNRSEIRKKGKVLTYERRKVTQEVTTAQQFIDMVKYVYDRRDKRKAISDADKADVLDLLVKDLSQEFLALKPTSDEILELSNLYPMKFKTYFEILDHHFENTSSLEEQLKVLARSKGFGFSEEAREVLGKFVIKNASHILPNVPTSTELIKIDDETSLTTSDWLKLAEKHVKKTKHVFDYMKIVERGKKDKASQAAVDEFVQATSKRFMALEPTLDEVLELSKNTNSIEAAMKLKEDGLALVKTPQDMIKLVQPSAPSGNPSEGYKTEIENFIMKNSGRFLALNPTAKEIVELTGSLKNDPDIEFKTQALPLMKTSRDFLDLLETPNASTDDYKAKLDSFIEKHSEDFFRLKPTIPQLIEATKKTTSITAAMKLKKLGLPLVKSFDDLVSLLDFAKSNPSPGYKAEVQKFVLENLGLIAELPEVEWRKIYPFADSKAVLAAWVKLKSDSVLKARNMDTFGKALEKLKTNYKEAELDIPKITEKFLDLKLDKENLKTLLTERELPSEIRDELTLKAFDRVPVEDVPLPDKGKMSPQLWLGLQRKFTGENVGILAERPVFISNTDQGEKQLIPVSFFEVKGETYLVVVRAADLNVVEKLGGNLPLFYQSLGKINSLDTKLKPEEKFPLNSLDSIKVTAKNPGDSAWEANIFKQAKALVLESKPELHLDNLDMNLVEGQRLLLRVKPFWGAERQVPVIAIEQDPNGKTGKTLVVKALDFEEAKTNRNVLDIYEVNSSDISREKSLERYQDHLASQRNRPTSLSPGLLTRRQFISNPPERNSLSSNQFGSVLFRLLKEGQTAQSHGIKSHALLQHLCKKDLEKLSTQSQSQSH